jgi:opacity protein-like surface antigen
MRKILLALLVSLFATASQAAPVSAVGDTFSVDFNGIVDYGPSSTPTVMNGLTASAQFNVTGWSFNSGTNRTTVTFDIVIDNTSNASVWQSAVVTAIGFDTNPNALSGSTSGVFSNFVTGGSFPTGAGFNVEYCASGNRNNCNGPGNTPLNVNDANGTASVTMTFSGNLAQLDFSNFGIRWQALDSQQYGLRGGSGIGVPATTPPIPEPAAMAVFGIGALLVGAALRKRAQR